MSVEGIRQDIAACLLACSASTNIEIIGHVMDTIRVRRDETDYLIVVKEAPSE